MTKKDKLLKLIEAIEPKVANPMATPCYIEDVKREVRKLFPHIKDDNQMPKILINGE